MKQKIVGVFFRQLCCYVFRWLTNCCRQVQYFPFAPFLTQAPLNWSRPVLFFSSALNLGAGEIFSLFVCFFPSAWNSLSILIFSTLIKERAAQSRWQEYEFDEFFTLTLRSSRVLCMLNNTHWDPSTNRIPKTVQSKTAVCVNVTIALVQDLLDNGGASSWRGSANISSHISKYNTNQANTDKFQPLCDSPAAGCCSGTNWAPPL